MEWKQRGRKHDVCDVSLVAQGLLRTGATKALKGACICTLAGDVNVERFSKTTIHTKRPIL